MVAEELKVLIRAETSKAVREMKKAQKGMDRSAKSANNMVKALAKKAAAWGGAVLSVKAFVAIAKKSVEAFRAQEEAEAMLRGALIATGESVDETGAKIRQLASDLQQVTTFGDETTIQASALLQTLGDLSGDGLERVIPLVQDFATGMGMDLKNAAQLVGKTLGSTTNALSRYGIDIDATASKSEKLEELTTELESKFGGLSRQMADTASGSLTQLDNAMGDFWEQVGRELTNNAQPFVNWLTDMANKATEARKELLDLRDIMEGDSNLSLEEQRQRLLARRAEAIENLRKAREAASRESVSQWDTEASIARTTLDAQEQALADVNSRLSEINTRLQVGAKYSELNADWASELERREAERARVAALIEDRTAAVAEYQEKLADIDTDRSLGLKTQAQATEAQRKAAADLYKTLQDLGYTEDLRDANGELQQGAVLMRNLREEIEAAGAAEGSVITGGDTGGGIRELFAQRRKIQQEFYQTERERIEQQKQAYIAAGVDRVDAEAHAQEQIRQMNLKTAQEVMGAFSTVYGQLGGIVSAYATLERQELQRTMAMYDERMEQLTEQHERQLEFAEASGATEKELRELKKQQAEEEEALEKEKEKERKKAEKKAFKREKAMNIAETTMAGAQAFVQALTAGPVAGPILASAIAGMTAAQLSLISQQQFPGLASGGIVPAQGEGGGLYRLGDKNKAETVLPFDIRQGGGMGSSSVVFNGPVNAYGAGGVDELADTIDRSIRRQKKTGAIPA